MNLSFIFIAIIAALVIVFFGFPYLYKIFLIPQNNQTAGSAQNLRSTRTTTIVNAKNDMTEKCASAGGICALNCQSALTGSASGNFLEKIFSWFDSLFAQTNSSAIIGGVIGSSTPQEIGSYPSYCTEQLPKCCESISITSTSSTTTKITTVTTTSIPSQLLDTAVNALDNDLNSAINESFADIENALLQ